ncbi:MAG: cytochrome-c oxidase, cbb3-type subunit III [Pseudomonadota bacterium]
MTERDVDQTSGIETTGHEWDGIKELNNPLPRWWLWTFYATILFSVGYIIYYPAIPLIETATSGISGQTNRGDLRIEMAAAQSAKAEMLNQIAEKDLESIRADNTLSRFAVAGGASAYKVYCSQCHGSGAQGGPGFPNLNDDDWLWGGDLEAIYTSIKHGIRNTEDEDARESQMPAFGADEILDREEINSVTQYVLQVSGQEFDSTLASAGKEIFVENCAACHGENAAGDRSIGAPNLADAISLYGNTEETIVAQIIQPQHGVMPPWQQRLSDETIKQLAVYVHSLGGGEKAASE